MKREHRRRKSIKRRRKRREKNLDGKRMKVKEKKE
jgi:hypothetical protein